MNKTKSGIMVEFTHVPESRYTKQLGPYVYAQVTYESLRVGFSNGTDADLARYDAAKDIWWYDGQQYTDVILSPVHPPEPAEPKMSERMGELIADLLRWRHNRERMDLGTDTLRRAIVAIAAYKRMLEKGEKEQEIRTAYRGTCLDARD